jgi:pSer/pThr/pTyr-binding forkhead associated (FHA) protein
MRAKLVIARGSSKGKEFDITGAQFVIGRAAGCNLRPQSDAISRQHCALFNKDEKVIVKDLGSRNGTVLNGEKLTKSEELRTGDELQVGPLHFHVVLMNDQGKVIEAPGPDIHDHQVQGLPSDSGLISDWLLQEDLAEKSKRGADPETRQFKIEESDLIKLDDEDVADKKLDKAGAKKKKEYGKLPKQKDDGTANSRDAAEETLKKLFNRNG